MLYDEEEHWDGCIDYPTEEEDGFNLIGWIAASLIIAMIVILVVFWPGSAHAQEYPAVMVCDAIYRAEGGAKAQYAYGIRSVSYKDISEAQRICLNSVRNSHRRWVKAGRPGDFIAYMGKRYSPPKQNPNWVRLVHYFLRRNHV